MIRPATCVVVTCDRCDLSAGEDNDDVGGVVHFASVDDAIEQLTSWHLAPGGDAVCPACLIKEECATKGHDFDAWRTCRCRGARPKHEAAMTVDDIVIDTCPAQVRRCQRCHLAVEEKFPRTKTPPRHGARWITDLASTEVHPAVCRPTPSPEASR